MLRRKTNSTCDRIRERLARALADRLDLSASWLIHHAAECPRCRRRLKGLARVQVAMSLIKTQQHTSDLLMRANRKAVGMLKRRERQTTRAQAMAHILPTPSLVARMSKYFQPVTTAAACLALALLIRAGVFSSMIDIHDRGRQIIEEHYAQYFDEDTHDLLM